MSGWIFINILQDIGLFTRVVKRHSDGGAGSRVTHAEDGTAFRSALLTGASYLAVTGEIRLQGRSRWKFALALFGCE